MSFKDLLVMLLLMAIIAIALAIDSIVTALPLVILAIGVSASLIIVTTTTCIIRYKRWQLEQHEKFYIEQPFQRITTIKSKLLGK